MVNADGERGMIRGPLDDLIDDTARALSRKAGVHIAAEAKIERLVAKEAITVPDARFRGLPLKDLSRQHLEGLCAWLLKKLHEKHLRSLKDMDQGVDVPRGYES